jgi:hypothetical protein
LFPVVIEVIRNTAKRIVTPSVQPVVQPYSIIPTMVDATAATIRIYSIVSERHSITNRYKGVSGLKTGLFEPNRSRILATSSSHKPACINYIGVHLIVNLIPMQ